MRREWRENWPVVLAAALCLAFATVPYVTVGIFMLPLQQEFGWSRTAISVSVPISGITIALLSPFVGRLIDRIGARRVGLSGGLAVCVLFATLSQVTPSIGSYWAIWAFLAVGIAFSSPLVWSTGITSRFHYRRGSALALMFCGSSLSQALAGPMGVALIDSFGWRGAYIGIAAVTAVVTLPVAWFLFYDARDLARVRRSRGGGAAAPAPERVADGLSVSEALHTPHFWLMAAAVFFGSGAILAAIVHFVPMQVDRGFTPMMAASAAVGIAIAGAAGKLLSGFLLDRFPAPLIAGAIFLFASAAFLLLMMGVGAGFGGAVLVAVLLGIAGGAEVDVIAFLTVRYFGLRSYGAIYGLFFGAYQLGVGISPVALSRVRDEWSAYDPAFPVLLILCFASALLLFAMQRLRSPLGRVSRPLALTDA